MKKTVIPSIITILLLIFISLTACANDKGVNDLRGQWLFSWDGFGDDDSLPLSIFINDIEPDQDVGSYLAAGCMRSPATDDTYPLALRAVYEPATNRYNLSIYSTVIQADPYELFGIPYLINFTGIIEVNGASVNDDLAYGDYQSEGPNGTWQGTHSNRRRTKCPPVDMHGQRLDMDLAAHIALDAGLEGAGYDVSANDIRIVASALRVTAPDGQGIVAPMYTDIWSPDADFVTVFRFRGIIDGALPISGQPYQFVLLDILGNPIPGTETEDIWTHCGDAAPANLQFDPNPAREQDVVISWVGIEAVPGEFVPGEIGYYQFSIDPVDGSMDSYGADFIGETYHVIPWGPFEPGTDGFPDGRDVGISLMDFRDGEYRINIIALYDADPSNGGFSHECTVTYQNQDIMMEKQGSTLTFSPLE